MKRVLYFALRILGLRLAVLVLALAQTTLWASELGMAGFGVVSTYMGAQMLVCLVGRFGADNVLVRQYRSDPAFAARLPGYLLGATVFSIGIAASSFVLIDLAVLRDVSATVVDGLIFVALVLGFNLAQIGMQLALAQKRQVVASLMNGVVPLAVSVGLFWAFGVSADVVPSLSPHSTALGWLAFGYAVAVLGFAVLLRGLWADCRTALFGGRVGLRFLLGPEQLYFLGYQGMGMLRQQGTVLLVTALFGPGVTGVFSLALRFGNLPTYLNEPARLFVLPRITGRSRPEVARAWRHVLGLNLGLGVFGLAALIGAWLTVPLPFDDSPPFALWTSIVMVAAAINLFVGPVGAILAMSGNEKRNFEANLVALVAAAALLVMAGLLDAPLIAVLAISVSNVLINAQNTVSAVSWVGSKQRG